MLTLQSVLILDLTFYKIVKRKDIPSIIGLGLDLTFCTGLETCLGNVEPILLVKRQIQLFTRISVRH